MINRERKAPPYSGMPTNKCRRNDRGGKECRQISSRMLKPEVKLTQARRYVHRFKTLINYKGKTEPQEILEDTT